MGKFTVFKEGGFATLHQVEYDGIPCIQKILKTEYQISEFQRLEREYRILQKMNHPNIIKVYANDGASYIMEKAECNLEDFILNNSLSDDKIDEIVDGIIDGLLALHSTPLSVVHRDLNPRNILMINGIPKIADLGICKPLETKTIQTLKIDREGLGTFGYMCPAQFNGDTPSFYFDIYALGRIIYFIETKKNPPFAGQLPALTSSRYKNLILATQQDQPILIPDIKTFIEKKKSMLTIQIATTEAVNRFVEGTLDIASLVAVIQQSKNHNEFDLLSKSMDNIVEKINDGDNGAIKLVADLYINEFKKYSSQRYWTYSKTELITDDLLFLYNKCNEDLLKQRILLEAFNCSYGENQWNAMDTFDKHVKSLGTVFFDDCTQQLTLHNVEEELISRFIERNSKLKF